MNLFYAPDLDGDIHTLNEEESRHCLKVLRLKKGDIIHITDGHGRLFQSEIISITGKECLVRLIENIATDELNQGPGKRNVGLYGRRNYHLHLAVAPTKNIDRFEWFLEKATEIGIDEITPLVCEHSERRHVRIDRLEKVVTAAMKQSLKAWHPKLNEATEFIEFVNKKFGQDKFMAYVTDDAPMLQEVYHAGKSAVILIGPEGDFSKNEVEKASGEGYTLVSLGNSRLRTETAAIVACHTVYLKNIAVL